MSRGGQPKPTSAIRPPYTWKEIKSKEECMPSHAFSPPSAKLAAQGKDYGSQHLRGGNGGKKSTGIENPKTPAPTELRFPPQWANSAPVTNNAFDDLAVPTMSFVFNNAFKGPSVT